jgi:beta-galactosidase
VTGGGEFVAADNGDESDFTWFGAKDRRAFNGLLSVIVRAKEGVAGPIEIKVESKGLEPATVMLKTKGK